MIPQRSSISVNLLNLIMRKTIGELIDEISITNIKIALIFEKGSDATWDELEKAQKLNSYRSELKNAINEYFNERVEIKTSYGK